MKMMQVLRYALLIFLCTFSLAQACNSNLVPVMRSGLVPDSNHSEHAVFTACNAEMEAGLPATIYVPDDAVKPDFDLNRDQINKIRNYLQRFPQVGLIFVGHTDERGTNEMNFALGLRYAENVKSYFQLNGFDANRFRTVSFGEGKPEDTTHSNDAWARNRRVFVVPFLLEKMPDVINSCAKDEACRAQVKLD